MRSDTSGMKLFNGGFLSMLEALTGSGNTLFDHKGTKFNQ